MKALLLGAGMQGRAAFLDLAGCGVFSDVVVGDRDPEALARCLASRGTGARVAGRQVDAADPGALDAIVADGFDVIVDLLPAALMGAAATAAVRHGAHLVNTMYVRPEVRALAGAAAERGVSILPEFGMDPGIDLVLLGEAVREFDTVTGLLSYGAGIPEPRAAGNALRYKVSWTFEGVLRSYRRAALVVRDGAVVRIAPGEQFVAEHVHEVDVEGVGRLEAYPNGDVLAMLAPLGIDVSHLRNAGRFSMRYPGHCALWRTLVALGLLDDEPVVVDGASVDRTRYLAAALEPALRYADDERDLAILRLVVEGTRDGRRACVTYDVLDRKDLASGLSAMSRLVGYTASIGAQMIATGVITRRGVLSPVTDVPWAPLAHALERRGISVRRTCAP